MREGKKAIRYCIKAGRQTGQKRQMYKQYIHSNLQTDIYAVTQATRQAGRKTDRETSIRIGNIFTSTVLFSCYS
jgi:hypothetical protein